MFTDFCYSCAAPLDMPFFQGPVAHYCNQCVDEDGNLKPYMKSTPAWWIGSRPGSPTWTTPKPGSAPPFI